MTWGDGSSSGRAAAAFEALQIQKGILDAKGDMIVATADNTQARLAVGTNGYLLTPDSTQANGVKWAGLSAGSDLEGVYPDFTIKDSVLTDPNALANSVETMPRGMRVNATLNVSSGQLLLAYFTPQYTQTITKMSWCSGTTATATPTLIRLGFYSIDSSGNGTLVCAIANDTTMVGSTTSVEYERNLSTGGGLPSSYQFIAGSRYAGAVLIVATTPGTISGNFNVNAASMARSPRLSGSIASQTDLPTSFTAASVATVTRMPYVAGHA